MLYLDKKKRLVGGHTWCVVNTTTVNLGVSLVDRGRKINENKSAIDLHKILPPNVAMYDLQRQKKKTSTATNSSSKQASSKQVAAVVFVWLAVRVA